MISAIESNKAGNGGENMLDWGVGITGVFKAPQKRSYFSKNLEQASLII